MPPLLDFHKPPEAVPAYMFSTIFLGEKTLISDYEYDLLKSFAEKRNGIKLYKIYNRKTYSS